MQELQVFWGVIGPYFDTLVTLAKIGVACLLVDSVCLLMFGCFWFAGQMRRG